jgi:hypothetical protein
MKISATNSETGEEFDADLEGVEHEAILNFFNIDLSDEALKRKINNLNISADAKSMLFSIAKGTVLIGQKILQIGRKILDVIFKIISDFPTMTAGAIICIVLSMLISSVPIIGFVFGPLLGPLLITFGIAVGVIEDLKNAALQRRITKTLADFETLKTGNA